MNLTISELVKSNCNAYFASLETKISAGTYFSQLHIQTQINCSLSGYEKLIVVFKRPDYFLDYYGNQLSTTLLKAKAPKYTYIDAQAAETVESSGTAFSVTSLVTFGIVIALNLLQSAAVSSFWAFVNMLQIISYLPIIKCNIPYNLEVFLTQYLSVSKTTFPFKMLPKWVPNPLSIFMPFLVVPFSERFILCGYESLSFIYNFSEELTTWLLLLVFYIALTVLCWIFPEDSKYFYIDLKK